MLKKIILSCGVICSLLLHNYLHCSAETTSCVVSADSSASGSYSKKVDTQERVPEFEWMDDVAVVKDTIATEEQKTSVDSNKHSMTAVITVVQQEYEEVKTVVNRRITEQLEQVEKNYKNVIPMDISLNTAVKDSNNTVIQSNKVHELREPLTLNFKIPEFDPDIHDAVCQLLHILNNGTVESLRLSYNPEDTTFIFETQSFSTYILYYTLLPKEEQYAPDRKDEPDSPVIPEIEREEDEELPSTIYIPTEVDEEEPPADIAPEEKPIVLPDDTEEPETITPTPTPSPMPTPPKEDKPAEDIEVIIPENPGDTGGADSDISDITESIPTKDDIDTDIEDSATDADSKTEISDMEDEVAQDDLKDTQKPKYDIDSIMYVIILLVIIIIANIIIINQVRKKSRF